MADGPQLGAGLVGQVAPPWLHVMTWNVRRPVPHLRRTHPDRWELRAPRVQRLLRDERPSVLALQEVLPSTAPLLRDALGDGYRLVGRGRGARGTGESCPLLVDTRRLELTGWRQLALSADPERPGSRRLGDLAPRVAVLAELRDRATGGELVAIGTHLDPMSGRSRLRAARQLRRLVVESGRPAVVMGDFNAGLGSPPHQELADGMLLVDPFQGTGGTHVGTFGRYRTPRPGGTRLDWILLSPQLEVPTIATDAAPVDGGWGSDHLPVHAVVRLPAH